jgi:hypothetical protein
MLEPGQGLDLYVTALSNLSDLSRGHRETKGILNEGRLRTGDPLTYGKLSAADATQRREGRTRGRYRRESAEGVA